MSKPEAFLVITSLSSFLTSSVYGIRGICLCWKFSWICLILGWFSKYFFITCIAILLFSVLLSRVTCLDFLPDDFSTILMQWLLSLICYNFLTVKYQDILVIKMIFICRKRFYKIPEMFVCRDSIFSDPIKVFLYAFPP